MTRKELLNLIIEYGNAEYKRGSQNERAYELTGKMNASDAESKAKLAAINDQLRLIYSGLE